VSRVEKRDPLRSKYLGLHTHRLGHCKIDRELDDFEVVVFATDVARQPHQLFEAEMVTRLRQNTESIPSRAPVTADDSTFHLLFHA